MTTRNTWEKSWKEIADQALDEVQGAASLECLEALRLRYLGRKGLLTSLLKDLKDLSIEDRRELGAPANTLKEELGRTLDTRKAQLERCALETELSKTGLDLALPGVPAASGRLHPLTSIITEITGILAQQGFAQAEGPLVESDYYNFEALNIPQDHPARDLQDTFYVDAGQGSPSQLAESSLGRGERKTNCAPGSMLLRTHTSPVQIRFMKSTRPPLRIMAPGRVFRHEALDASHSAVFHQVEGLYVDKHVTLADLKGTLQTFLQTLYGSKIAMRFRPSYYPFTEPSADVEIRCIFCAGAGCPVCKQSGWLEVLGAGVVHPNVFKAVGYDPELWSGFAFGLGVERIAMLRYGIQDIRMFYQNDVRFLEQFE